MKGYKKKLIEMKWENHSKSFTLEENKEEKFSDNEGEILSNKAKCEQEINFMSEGEYSSEEENSDMDDKSSEDEMDNTEEKNKRNIWTQKIMAEEREIKK